MLKKIGSNPAVLFLLAGNLYCIWYYQQNPATFYTIVWIYWFQSIIIGLFNFLDLLTVKNFDSNNFTMNNQPVARGKKGCMAWFFLFHFGMFHLVYAVFLLVDTNILLVSRKFLWLGIVVFLLESILNFRRQKQIESTMTVNLGTLFFLPYLRIVPMHLMILLPKFFGWTPSLLFLVLKMGADIFSYLLYQYIYGGNKAVNSIS